MRYFCISSDADVLAGLRLCGITGVLACDAKAVAAAVERAESDESIAVLLVTDGCYALCSAELDALKLSAHRPLVNIIPDSAGSQMPGDHITRLITEAIGVKL